MKFRLVEEKEHKKYTQEEIQNIIDKIVKEGNLSVWAMNDFRPATTEPSNSPDYPYESEDAGEYRNVDKITIDSFEVDEDEDEDFYSLVISFTAKGCKGIDDIELEFSTDQVSNLEDILLKLFDEIDVKYSLYTGSPFEYEIDRD